MHIELLVILSLALLTEASTSKQENPQNSESGQESITFNDNYIGREILIGSTLSILLWESFLNLVKEYVDILS